MRRGRIKEAKQAVREARQAASDDDWAAAEAAVRRWLSARLERRGAGAALSPLEASDVLAEHGAPLELGAELGRLLGRIEAARYGGGTTSGLAGALADWLDTAQKEWR